MYKSESDLTHPRLTNKNSIPAVQFVFRQQLCIPQAQTMMAYMGRNML